MPKLNQWPQAGKEETKMGFDWEEILGDDVDLADAYEDAISGNRSNRGHELLPANTCRFRSTVKTVKHTVPLYVPTPVIKVVDNKKKGDRPCK